MKDQPSFGSFNLREIAQSFPAAADSMLLDVYLTDDDSASTRVFRVYRSTPPHFHAGSNEYLYVLSGTGVFWMDDPANRKQFGPGDMLFFKKGIVHAMPEIHSGPVVFFAIDSPRRDPKDIIFANPEDGTPESFIGSVSV